MAIMVTCSCGKTLQAKDEWAGKSVKCPGCQTVLKVPGLKAGSPPAPAAAPKAPPRRPRDEEEIEEEQPVGRRRRDEDEDDRPRKKKRGGGGGGGGDIRDLKEVSPGMLILLGMVTFGIYPLIHIATIHDKLPVEREDDPNFSKTLILLLVPGLNMFYGIWLVYRRLATRINEQCERYGLEPDLSDPLTPMVLSVICCTMPIGYIMMLVWMVKMQSKVNELIQAANG